MIAIILAAGINSRLKNEIDIPKTLLKVGNSTILERQINALINAGIKKEDIFVINGYQHEMITAVHNNTIFNEKFREWNNSYSVYLGLEKLKEKIESSNQEVLIFDGDLVYDTSLIKQILDFDKPNIMVTKETPYSTELKDEIIIPNENSEIMEMTIPERGNPLDEKYKNQKLFSFLGILKLSAEKAKELRQALSIGEFWETWYTMPMPTIVNKGNFYNFPVPKSLKFCFDVDTKEDYEKLKELNKKPYKMFVCGPVNVSQKVKEAMVYPEIGHREPEFTNLFRDIKQKLLYPFGVESKPDRYGTVVIGGSGTSAMETLLCSVLHNNKKTLVISNGAFGDRMADICNLHNIPTIKMDYGWGGYPKTEEIEQKLKENPDIEAAIMILMETSTGALNPVKATGELCKKYNKTLIVDAISSLGGENLNMEEDNIDYCLTNTNKGLGGLPVLGIICYNKQSLEKSKDIKPRSYSLDLFKHIKYAEKNQTPFTPQIPLFYMLNEALNELKQETKEKRINRFKENGTLLKQKLKEFGLKFQLKDEEMSNLMVNTIIPEGLTYQEIHDKMKEKGYVFYPGKGPLDGKVVHFANIGTLQKEDILQFCDDLKEVINRPNLS
jgi:2-aminoethylphosphonate-pyruvate transaminase